MRSYSVAVSALEINAPHKWIDNVISHQAVDGVISARRGVPRRLSFGAILIVATARALQEQLSVPLLIAVPLAHELVRGGGAVAPPHGSIVVSTDIEALRRTLEARLADALESAPTPRRGRPPSK